MADKAKRPWELRGYRTPTHPRIGECRETRKLYQAEERMRKEIKAATEELRQALGVLYADPTAPLLDFWREALPEELFTVLEGFEVNAAQAAAATYLETQGYTVIDPKGDADDH